MADEFFKEMIGAGAPISTITGKPVPTAQEKMAPGKEFIDVLSALLPGISDVRDVGEAVSGKDIFGENLTLFERAITGLAAMVPLLPGSVRKIIPKLKSVTDQKSLEEVGNAIAEAMGVKRKIKWEFLPHGEGYAGRYLQKVPGKPETIRIAEGAEETSTDEKMYEVIAHELLHSFPEYRYSPEGVRGFKMHDLNKLSEEEFNELLPTLKKMKNHPQEFYNILKDLFGDK
jgi:hypothetical protein